MDYQKHYKNLESLLSTALGLLGNTLSKTEADEIQEFIDASEYGVALESLVYIITEKEKPVSQEVLKTLKQAAIAMNLNQSIVELDKYQTKE